MFYFIQKKFLKRFNSSFQLVIIVFHSSFHNVMQSPKIPELSILVFLDFQLLLNIIVILCNDRAYSLIDNIWHVVPVYCIDFENGIISLFDTCVGASMRTRILSLIFWEILDVRTKGVHFFGSCHSFSFLFIHFDVWIINLL